MSHWLEKKCELKCSIDVMKRALIKLNPEWERHIEVSSDNALSIDNQHTRERAKTGYTIKIKGAQAGGSKDLPYADIGLKKHGDGTWSITYDPAGKEYIRNFDETVQGVVTHMRGIAQAIQNGGKLLRQPTFDRDTAHGEALIEIEIDDGEEDIHGIEA